MLEWLPIHDVRVFSCDSADSSLLAERSNGYNNRSSRRGPPLVQKVVHVDPRDHDGRGGLPRNSRLSSGLPVGVDATTNSDHGWQQVLACELDLTVKAIV